MKTDGQRPKAGLAVSGSTLYGTTENGGHTDSGVVFKINTDGTGYRVLKYFEVGEARAPRGQVILSGNTLYGTTTLGANYLNGTVFKINTDGTGYSVLHQFNSSDGSNPAGVLLLSDGILYGTAVAFGPLGAGVVFKLNMDGTGYTIIHSFAETNGMNPHDLALSDHVLYGTTEHGGSLHEGTVFRVNTDGTGFVMLKDFDAYRMNGAFPMAGLAISGGTLYGATKGGGSWMSGFGLIFGINADGMGFTVLRRFSNSDGAVPCGTLILSGGTLYGTTRNGGSMGYGTVFKMNTDGSNYEILWNFSSADGRGPEAALVMSDNTLYGVAAAGGATDAGTIFSISLVPDIPLPALTIADTETNSVLLSWPVLARAVGVEQSADMDPAKWVTLTNTPIVVEGSNQLATAKASGTRFYRLVSQ